MIGKRGKNRYKKQPDSSSYLKRRAEINKKVTIVGIVLLVIILIAMLLVKIFGKELSFSAFKQNKVDKIINERPELDVQLLTLNPFSRPGIPLENINSIVIHYTANPGSTAQNNRDYFEGLKDSQETSASSHFIVGLEGEIIQCIPSSEISYASNNRNNDTISIEVCHPDENGKFSDVTYKSLVNLVAWLRGEFNISNEEIIRHYDITGKSCPKYFVDNEDKWIKFKKDVDKYINKHGVEVTQSEN